MDSPLVECAIGLVFLYATLSLFCTSISEFVSRWSGWRSKSLQSQLTGVLRSDSNRLEEILRHPLVCVDPEQWGSMVEVPSRGFVLAMLAVLSNTTPTTAAALKTAAKKIKDPGLQQAVLTTIASAGDDKAMEPALTALTTWFDSVMAQGTDQYRSQTSKATGATALVIVLALNIDTFSFLERLWKNQPLRESLVAAGVRYSEEQQAKKNEEDGAAKTTVQSDAESEFAKLSQELNRFPLGWHLESKETPGTGADPAAESKCRLSCTGLPWLLKKAAGFALTWFAITLGAPFWFDLLAQLASMRKAARGQPTVKPAA
jgi:hypothetical protein